MLKTRVLATALALPLVFSVGQLQALTVDKDCNYTDTTVSETTGTIAATRNYKSATADYSESHRVCVVRFDASVNGKWRSAHANYIFGPNLSENVACDKAKEKAKVSVLEQYAPVIINSKTQNKCVEILKSKPKVVYVDRPVYVEKKVYVNKPIVRNIPRRKKVGPAQCYADCVRGNCECYDTLAEEKRKRNSILGLGSTQLMTLFNFGQLIYGQYGMRN